MAEQEWLQAEARTDQERLREETQLNQARLMAEIEASRRTMEEHAHANEELRRNMNHHGRLLPESAP